MLILGTHRQFAEETHEIRKLPLFGKDQDLDFSFLSFLLSFRYDRMEQPAICSASSRLECLFASAATRQP